MPNQHLHSHSKRTSRKGLLPSGEIKNPKTDESFKMDNVVEITYDGTRFSYNYDTTQDE